jgi:hypothetical protein
VTSTVAWNRLSERAQHPCWGTGASTGDDLCIIRGNSYSKAMFQHVSGCFCYFYMNSAFFKRNITIEMRQCRRSDEFEYPCVWVSVRETFGPHVNLQMEQFSPRYLLLGSWTCYRGTDYRGSLREKRNIKRGV